jgi:hypothetical protein
LLIPARDILAIQQVNHVYVVVLTAALILGAVFEALSPLSRHDIARSLDAKCNLQERLQTALEVYQRDDVQLARLLISDAVAALGRMKSERLSTTERLPAEGYYFLATAAIALLLLYLPAIPAQHPAKGSGILTHRTDGMSQKDAKKPADQDNGARPHEAVSQVSLGKPTFSDTVFASEPPDFASFVKSGGDRLNLLDPNRKNSKKGGKPSPYQVSLRQRHGETTAFESDTVSAEEASERVTVVEGLSKRSGNGSQRPGETHRQSTSAAASSGDAATSEGASASERHGVTKEPDLQGPTGGGSEGGEKGANDPKGSTETPTGQIQAPAGSPNRYLGDTNIHGPRFGGGQYPHNVPGAGFPESLRGPEDPHFMDAGQGEGENTGKTSGQPGVGHAKLKEGAANDAITLPEPKDIRLSGQLQPGNQVSYETDTLGPGAESSPRVSFKEVPTEYEFQAEEEMSREQVPFSYRAQVKAYFSNLR